MFLPFCFVPFRNAFFCGLNNPHADLNDVSLDCARPETQGHYYVTHLGERCCFGNEAVESGGEDFRVGNDALADVTVQARLDRLFFYCSLTMCSSFHDFSWAQAVGEVSAMVLSRHNFEIARMIEAHEYFASLPFVSDQTRQDISVGRFDVPIKEKLLHFAGKLLRLGQELEDVYLVYEGELRVSISPKDVGLLPKESQVFKEKQKGGLREITLALLGPVSGLTRNAMHDAAAR